MRQAGLALIVFSIAAIGLSASELGRADGTLTIDRNPINLTYAYAIGRQHNEITKRKDDVKIVLTDKALAPETDFGELEATLPADMYAVIFNVASNGRVTHVSVLYPKGSYDGGYLDEVSEFHFKNANGSRGTMAGRISSSRVQTNTMAFTVIAEFNALMK